MTGYNQQQSLTMCHAPRSFPTARFYGAALLLALLITVYTSGPCAAQRIVFERGGALHAIDWGRAENGTPSPLTGSPRRLHEVGTASGTLWAAAPDGRRVAWLIPRRTPTSGNAAALFIGDMTGRRSKRLLTLDELSDRQGRVITHMAMPRTGDDTEGTEGTADSLEAAAFDSWQIVSLSWSADSRTLYLSGMFLPPARSGKASYAVDALTGAAIVDADGRWKPIADAAFLDARGTLLIGAGHAYLMTSGGGGAEAAEAVPYSPLILWNLAEGMRTVLLPPRKITAKLPPDFAFAAMPALSPDRRQIAFVSTGHGLWLVDTGGSRHSRLAEGSIRRPRWSPDGTSLLYLLRRESGGDSAAATAVSTVNYDLYEHPLTLDATVQPTRLLERVSWFDMTPD